MCGIAGVVAPTRPLDSLEATQVAEMADCLEHRGPDSSGLFRDEHAALASRRLAIIDLRTGDQPVKNEDGTIVAVLNGEIYNYRELRARLLARGHVLRSQGDTEVLVHLYEEHGTDLLDAIEGQFALAVWDARRHRLLLARDRIGICPLHYHQAVDGTVAFASEAKALIGAGIVAAELDEVGLSQVACLGCAVAPRTLFRRIRSLAPAHRLEHGRDGTRIGAYWDLDFPARTARPVLDYEACVRGLSERLERAVARTLQSDVPVGTFLSGGIDSGLITALAARASSHPLPAFTIGSPHRFFDERDGARRSSEWAGSPLETLVADGGLIAREFEALVFHAETPVLSTEAAALLALAGLASKRVKVVLTGEGSDEAFAGYQMYAQHQWLSRLGSPGLDMLRSATRPLLRAWHGWTDFLLPPEARLSAIVEGVGCFPAQAQEYEFYRTLVPLVFQDDLAETILRPNLWAGLGLPMDRLAGRHWLDQSLYIGYKVMLPGYLLGPHGDRALMAHSVEGRYPFLDREVVEFAACLPPRWKVRGLKDKRILRAAARGLLPPEIVAAPKKRFMTPFGSPFVGRQATEKVRALLRPDMLMQYGYFDPNKVERVVRALTAASASAPGFGRNTRAMVSRLGLGIAVNLVASVQLFHYLFLEGAGLRRPRRPGLPSVHSL